MVTQAKVRDVLDYDPDTGIFRWRHAGASRKAGAIAGNIMHDGRYIRIGIGGKSYLAHRLAWLYVHGQWPTEIDHINWNGLDNRMVNLRSVTRKQNGLNRGLNKNNTSGAKGVILVDGKWQSYYCRKYLGRFDRKDDAVQARREAEKRDGI